MARASRAGWSQVNRLVTLSTPLDDADYKIPFPFEGTINNITYKVDRPKLTSEQEKELREAYLRQQTDK